MSLQLAVQYTSITSDCGTVVITDTTGNYNASTNPTGYGAPNDARSILYLQLLVNLRKSTGREVITVPSYNQNTASSWTITITEDGWYEVYLFGCQAWGAGFTYGLNAIAFDVATNKFYQSIQAANHNNAVTNATWWKSITDIEDFILSETASISGASANTMYDTTTNKIELCRSKKCEGKMLLKQVEDGCCDDCGIAEYERVRMKIEAAAYDESLFNYSDAQEIVEDLNNICANLSDCNCG